MFEEVFGRMWSSNTTDEIVYTTGSIGDLDFFIIFEHHSCVDKWSQIAVESHPRMFFTLFFVSLGFWSPNTITSTEYYREKK